MPAETAPPLAGAWRRLMGITYESIILFAVVFFFGYAFSALTQFKGQAGWGRSGLQLWLFLVLAAYFSYFWSLGRKSLPMKTLNLAVVTAANRPLGLAHAFARYCAASAFLFAPLALAKFVHPLFAPLCLVVLAVPLVDRRSRALHDIACGTLLVVTPETPKTKPGTV